MEMFKSAEELGCVESGPYNVKATFSLQVIKQLSAINYAIEFRRNDRWEGLIIRHVLRGIAK